MRAKGANRVNICTTLYLNEQDVVIEARDCSGYYERCYPPESVFEIGGDIKIYTDDKEKTPIEYKSLSEDDKDAVNEAIEAAFWDQDFRPDYDQDDIGN